MAVTIISAEDLANLSATNSEAIDAELTLIEIGATARAVAGFYSYDHALTVPNTKAGVISYFSTATGFTVTVLDDGITLRIIWQPPLV